MVTMSNKEMADVREFGIRSGFMDDSFRKLASATQLSGVLSHHRQPCDYGFSYGIGLKCRELRNVICKDPYGARHWRIALA